MWGEDQRKTGGGGQMSDAYEEQLAEKHLD